MPQSWIIAELKHPLHRIPEGALLEAMEDPEEVIPGLLGILDETLENARVYQDRPDYTAHITSLFLLAQFREPRAFPRVQALLNLPEEQQEGLLGDLRSEGLSSILASLCGETPALLEAMAVDGGLDPVVRSSALEALLALGFQGGLGEDRLREIFGGILETFEARGAEEDPEAWASLAVSLAWHVFDPLLSRLEDAFSRGLVDLDRVNPESLDRDLALNEDHRKRRFLRQVHRVEDALLELQDLSHLVARDRMIHRFWGPEPDDGEEDEPQDGLLPLPPAALQAARAAQGPRMARPGRIPRNAPCPCGSGLKYKRCCGKG